MRTPSSTPKASDYGEAPDANSFDQALRVVEAALGRMSAGDPEQFIACWKESPDVTLYGAFGTVERGMTAVAETLRWVAARFSAGTLTPSYDVVHVRGDMAYTVGTEHGDVSVDGAEPKEMLIRVTHVYRYTLGVGWKILHRHADHPPTLVRQR